MEGHVGGMHPFVYGLGKPFMARLNLKANKIMCVSNMGVLAMRCFELLQWSEREKERKKKMKERGERQIEGQARQKHPPAKITSKTSIHLMLIWGLFSEVCIKIAKGNPAEPTTHDGDMADMAGGPKHPPAEITPKTSIHLIDVDLGVIFGSMH